jgi:hypothetical protein
MRNRKHYSPQAIKVSTAIGRFRTLRDLFVRQKILDQKGKKMTLLLRKAFRLLLSQRFQKLEVFASFTRERASSISFLFLHLISSPLWSGVVVS